MKTTEDLTHGNAVCIAMPDFCKRSRLENT